MPNYRRNRVPGGTYFFTVNLLDRNSTILVAQIELLRQSVRAARARAPFHIDAWVVLPDHMHSISTLPEGDDFQPLASHQEDLREVNSIDGSPDYRTRAAR